MSTEQSVNFEKSLKKLEDIVNTMEDESLSLELMIERYEEGVKTVKLCEKALKNAHKQLETIRQKNSNQTPSQPEETADDEIRLF